MHFFLAILSTIDAYYVSTTVPKSLIGALRNSHLISFSGCITQVFLVVTLASAELTSLTIMAYNRYVAICHPLQYMLIMNWTACFQMAGASWVCSIINGIIHTINIFSLHFCGSTIEQYFCATPLNNISVLTLSC